jgi:hypothetical protein
MYKYSKIGMHMVRNSVFVVAALLLSVPAGAEDRLLGLLMLPEVFGNGPCRPFEPTPVALYADADGKQSVGAIQVDRNWSFAPHGGCEGLEVSVHRGASRAELPTREYDYDAPAAIVIEQRGLAFRIRLSGSQSAWVQAPAANRFLPYESLLEEFVGVTFVMAGADGPLRRAPGGSPAGIGARVRARQPVRIIERSGDWLHVEVLSHPVCDAADYGPPDTVATGWMPSHLPSGEPTVWFSSRGCEPQ